MTYPVELPLSRQAGNGTTVVFAPGFALFSLTDLVVELRDDDDMGVTIVLNGAGTYDYLVAAYVFDAATSRYSNVAVQFNTAPPTGYKVGMARAGVQEQTLDLTAGGALPAESLERRLDRITALVQDLQQQAERALKEPVGSDALMDAGGKIIRGVVDPIDDTDVVTKGFLTVGQLEVDFIDGVTVNSISALRALNTGGSEPATAFVTGYVSISDGGGGLYYWDPEPTFVEDGATVIAPDSSVGSWRLNPNGLISRRQQGNLNAGGMILQSKNAAGTIIPMLTGDPDSDVVLKYAGDDRLTTLDDGVLITGVARSSMPAVEPTDLVRRAEIDVSQGVQDAALASGLAGKAALSHTHNYSLLTRYTSANLAVSAAAAVSHTLGGQPSDGHYGARLECLVSNLNYSAGDRVDLLSLSAQSGSLFYTPTIWANASQFGWAMPTTALYLTPKGGGTPAPITAGNWAIALWAEIVS